MTNEKAIDIFNRSISCHAEEERCITEACKGCEYNCTVEEVTKAMQLAISALEKQEIDKCCETCRHKYGSQQEPPCCDCYLATAYEDCYEAEEES